jgi:DNA-binding CsgD family transcriptional regulator
MTQAIAGRTAELESLTAFLDDRAIAPRAVLIEGVPGIGKTCLLRAVLDRADETGYAVAVCQPTRIETELSYAGLVGLLDGLDPDLVGDLPAPQASVLRTILRLEESAEPVDRLSLGLATVAAVRAAAERGPLVLAVDDTQWLDTPTARVLAFLVRRLSDNPVRLLFVRTRGAVPLHRDGPTMVGEPPVEWEEELARAMPEGRFERVDLGPVDPSDLSRILRRVLGWAPAWPRVVRIWELSEGNPLHALELARATEGAADEELADELPDSVLELARSRIEGLPDRVREVVGVAAVPRNPSLNLLEHLDPGSVDLHESLEAAARQGIVVTAGGRVHFSHPILAAAAYESLAPPRRQELHRALALLSDNLEERARHLATATDGPDAQVAVALESAAEQAWRRGAPDAAADLLRLACRLTPPEETDALGRRRIAHGRLLHSAGDAPAAVVALEAVVDGLPPGPLRARALFHLMYVVRIAGSLERAVELGAAAVEEATDDPLFQAEVLELLSRISDNDVGRKLDAARRASTLVERVPHPDPELVFQVRAALVEAEFYAGLGVRLDRLEGLSTEATSRFPPVRTASHGDDLAGRLLMYDGQVDDGLALLRGMYERAGVENRAILPTILGWMAEGQLSAGRFEDALRSTRDALARTEEIGSTAALPWELGLHAVALARLGFLDDAQTAAQEVLATTTGLDTMPARLALGVVAASRGDHDEAVSHLRLVDLAKRDAGIHEPRVCAHVADLLDALVSCGRLEEAAETLARLEHEAETSGGRWSLAVAARGRAQLLAALPGDLEQALAEVQVSAQVWEGLPAPFERARTLLLEGQLRRRLRQKLPARGVLEEALAVFEDVHASVWADRAHQELARLPGQRSGSALTPTEERVATLAAAGLTNRQIAERTFLSLKTVEVNLTRVYRKLGVRRAALAGKLDEIRVGDPSR